MDNRETITKAALDLFCRRGYDAVGVQEIADQAGITKPTLYYYFGSKKGLLEEILTSNCEQLDASLARETALAGGVPDGLFRIARVYYSFMGERRQFYLFLMSSAYAGRESDAFRTAYPWIRKYRDRLTDYFVRHAGELGNMNGRQRLFADSFLGVLDSHLMMLGRDRREDEKIYMSDGQIQGIVRQFLYGIFS